MLANLKKVIVFTVVWYLVFLGLLIGIYLNEDSDTETLPLLIGLNTLLTFAPFVLLHGYFWLHKDDLKCE